MPHDIFLIIFRHTYVIMTLLRVLLILTPSQNRVAEVKSGRFPETAKVLLFESHVPKCIRVDTISTTYFLQGNTLYLLCFLPNYYYLLDTH